MPTNTAAWLETPKQNPFVVKSSPYASPAKGQIAIKNHALAINPVDWKIQDDDIFSMKYPLILGEDVAGTVEDVGPACTRFRKGDRVLGHPTGLGGGESTENGFQEYTLLNEILAAHVPASIDFEAAAVLPLGTSTAAAGMFQKDFLGMQLPVPGGAKTTGKTLLVWGGSTSVGSCAVQLAVAAGYDVIATGSPKNSGYIRKLGASSVFDYNSRTVVDELVDAFKGKTCAGALDCVTVDGANAMCAEVLSKSQGGKFVAAVLQPDESKLPPGVTSKFLFAVTIAGNEVGKAVYEDFLDKALADGSYVPAPPPMVAGNGLKEIQKAVNAHKKGVSAKKVILSL